MTRKVDEAGMATPIHAPHALLGDVAILERGTQITKKEVQYGEIPVVAGGQAPAYFHNVANRSGHSIVVAGSGANAGFVSWWDKEIFVSDAFTVSVDENVVLPRFCYHWLRSKQETLYRFQSRGGVPHVYPTSLRRMRIPVPPLEVQQEIVRVLDQFTSWKQSWKQSWKPGGANLNTIETP